MIGPVRRCHLDMQGKSPPLALRRPVTAPTLFHSPILGTVHMEQVAVQMLPVHHDYEQLVCQGEGECDMVFSPPNRAS